LEQDVIPKDAKVAFCHNDVLGANVLYSDHVQLIDFEYGGINFVAFDIANHFNEYAGGTSPGEDATPNYDWFPSREQQRYFLNVYLEAAHHGSVCQDELETLLRQVQAFVLANHLYWGLWAVNQASAEGCEGFDYLLYAKHRMNRYLHDRAEWIKQ
jgi:ethanolamine kinase